MAVKGYSPRRGKDEKGKAPKGGGGGKTAYQIALEKIPNVLGYQEGRKKKK